MVDVARPEVPTLNLNGVTYRLPFLNLFRAHTEDERFELTRSIGEHGVVCRIVTFDSATWGRRCVIDGATRLSIAAARGQWALPVHHRGSDLTDDQACELAITLNCDRRHLTPEEQDAARRKRNAGVVQAREDGDSLRTIADQFGIALATVQKILTAAGVNAAEAKKRVKGRDGKSYSATRTKATPAQTDTAAVATDAMKLLNTARRSCESMRESLDALLTGEQSERVAYLFKCHQTDPVDPRLSVLAAVLADLTAEAVQV